jgi:hypothetical protein
LEELKTKLNKIKICTEHITDTWKIIHDLMTKEKIKNKKVKEKQKHEV